MGYVVLHLEKASGNDAGMSAHIERTIKPKNADETKTHLNKELINFPEEVKSRTEAIQHRLDNAGIKRKIGKNQVRAIRIMLSGTHEDMKDLEEFGNLSHWCNDNIEWLENTFGKDNLVSAVLHIDEKTPHIHATVVPIVESERRKAKVEENNGKRKYRKKDKNSVRLCADDVMARNKLKEYQNTYAEKMAKYGLQRGIEGSEAKHISTSQYYRNLLNQTESVQENIEQLLQQKTQVERELSKVKSEVSKEKLKNSAADVGASIMDGVGSLLGSSETKRLQNEVEELRTENAELKENFGNEIKHLAIQLQTADTEHTKITDQLRQELKKIYDLFPHIRELLRIENLCKYSGFSDDLTKMILEKKPVEFKGKIYSAEFKRDFETDYSVAEIKESTTEKGKLNFTIDGVSETTWFRQKQQEFLRAIGINIQPKQDRGSKNQLKQS